MKTEIQKILDEMFPRKGGSGFFSKDFIRTKLVKAYKIGKNEGVKK